MPHAVGVRATTTAATTTPQSILSRKRAARDEDDEETSQAPSKRLKVSFDADVDVKLVDRPGEKDVAVIKEEVRRAIHQRTTGESGEYEEIKDLFDAKPGLQDSPSTTLLRKYLHVLSLQANRLTGKFSDLVVAVLKTQWLAHDEAFASTYIRFLGQIGSSHSAYLPRIFRLLVANFSHLSTSAGVASRATASDRQKLVSRVHLALKYLLQLIPTSSGALLTVLAKSYPFIDETRKAHVDYARNLLKAIEYAPELKSDILDLITERLIKIDVEVQVDIDELEEDIEDLLVDDSQKQADHDDNIEDSEDESDDDDEDDVETAEELEERRIKVLKVSVGKMDALLDLLFTEYTGMSSADKSNDASAMFELLLAQFSKTVLPTYRSRHTQFLLFHFAQTSADFTNRFISTCLNIITDRTRTSFLRMSAAAYLGSFAARGTHISSDDTLHIFHQLSTFVDRVRFEYEPRCTGPNLKSFGPYYSAFQALTYIFCFRWRDLLADPEDFDDEDLLNGLTDLQWAPGVADIFRTNMSSVLNPLKVCAPGIVEEFAKIARHLNLVYVYHILDANKRVRLSQFVKTFAAMGRETALSGLHAEGAHQLDAYFPFDPYRLPASRKWVEEDYNEWKGVPGLHRAEPEVEDDSSAEDEDDDEEDDDAEITDGTQTPLGSQ